MIRRLIIALFFGGLLLITPKAQAHGGGTPQLINADIGPYWISTWVNPMPPQTDDFHLTIALSKPTNSNASLREAGPPILNAAILVQLQSPSDPTVIFSAAATHEQSANPFLYEVDFILPNAGSWQGTITVDGPDSGNGSIEFEIEVTENASLNWPVLFISGFTLVILAVFWLRRGG